ncbi:MAG: glycosyltransferase family A protein [Methylovirgula sp.]
MTKKQPFDLPKVSIIIINFNYGRFLLEAAESVHNQSYPNIELIIVDDASTDESGDVLDLVAELYPEAKIVRRLENGGQSAAALTGFEHSSGDYIVFVDADDILLEHFVATHIFVHLSLRVPVGFSSSDMLQMVGNRIVTGTLQYFSAYVRAQKSQKNLLRSVALSAPALWQVPAIGDDICNDVYWVKPTHHLDWIWAPCSGNCFRRDAVSIFFDNDALTDLRTATDAYLMRGIAALTGSVLIDRPLAVYRVHGANTFTRMAHLNGMLNYDPANNYDDKARRLAIDLIIRRIGQFARCAPNSFQLLLTLGTLNVPAPRGVKVWGGGTYAGGQIIKNFREVSRAVGLWPLVLLSLRFGVTPWGLVLALCRLAVGRRTKPTTLDNTV